MRPAITLLSICLCSTTFATEFDDRRLLERFPDARVASVQATSVSPWLEVVLEDGQVLYTTEQGRYLLVGNLIDLEGGLNLTENRRNQVRRDLIDARLPDRLFEFPAPAGHRWVTVVTDIDCPYCRRLHQQLAEYHARGISIRYLMLPRAGLTSASYRKAESAACSAEPRSALTAAMNGEEIPSAECQTSLPDQFALARALQVTGTPAIITDEGRMIPGYLPPARLAAELGLPAEAN